MLDRADVSCFHLNSQLGLGSLLWENRAFVDSFQLWHEHQCVDPIVCGFQHGVLRDDQSTQTV